MLPNMSWAYRHLNASQMLLLNLWDRRVRQRIIAEQPRITSVCVDVKPQWSSHNLMCQIPLQGNLTVAEWICRAMEAGPECWWDFGFLGIGAAEVWFGPTTATRVVVVAQEDGHTTVSMEIIHEQQTTSPLPRLYVSVVPTSSESPDEVRQFAAWNPNSLIQSHATDPGLNLIRLVVHRDPASCRHHWAVEPNAMIRGTVVRRQASRMLEGSLHGPIITVTPAWLQQHSSDNNAKTGKRQLTKSIKCSIPLDDTTTISQWIQRTMEKAPDEWWDFWGLPARDTDVWFGENSCTRMIYRDDDDALSNANNRRRSIPRHILMTVPKVYMTVSTKPQTSSNSSDAWDADHSFRSHILSLIEMFQYNRKFLKEGIELQLNIVSKPWWGMPSANHHHNPYHPRDHSTSSLCKSSKLTTAGMASEQPARVFVRHVTTESAEEVIASPVTDKSTTAPTATTDTDKVAEATRPLSLISKTNARMHRNNMRATSSSAGVSIVSPLSPRRLKKRRSCNTDGSSLRITRSASKSASNSISYEERVTHSDDTYIQSIKKRHGASKRERSTSISKKRDPKNEEKTSAVKLRPVARAALDPYGEGENSYGQEDIIDDDTEQHPPLSKKQKKHKIPQSADSSAVKTQSSSCNNTGTIRPVRRGNKTTRHRAMLTLKSRPMTRSMMVADDYSADCSSSSHRHGRQAPSNRKLRPIVRSTDPSSSSHNQKKFTAVITPSPRKRTSRFMERDLKKGSNSGQVNIGTLLTENIGGLPSQSKENGNHQTQVLIHGPVTRSRSIKNINSSIDITFAHWENQRLQKEVVGLRDTSCSNAVQHAIQVEANVPPPNNTFMRTPISIATRTTTRARFRMATKKNSKDHQNKPNRSIPKSTINAGKLKDEKKDSLRSMALVNTQAANSSRTLRNGKTLKYN